MIDRTIDERDKRNAVPLSAEHGLGGVAAERFIVGIDVGSTKVCTLIAQVGGDEQLEVLGVGVTRSDALRKGVVANVEQATEDILNSVYKAQQQSGFKVISAFVGVSGSHLQTQDARGEVTIRRSDRPIGEDEMGRAQDAARLANLPADREQIDLVPRFYSVDGQQEIASPLGMLGQRLEVHATLVTCSRGAIQNLTTCIERAGISIDALVPQPLAAAEAVLTPGERDLGVTLLDIGGGTTDIGVFGEGALLYASALPVGGIQISNDIAVRLHTPLSAADEVKVRHARAFNNSDDDRQIDISSFDSDESSSASLRVLCDTVEDRLVDTFELIRKRLGRAGFAEPLPAGTVLVGGTARLPGIRSLAAEVLETHVRIGSPGGVFGLSEQQSGPAFASSVGLLRWGLSHGDEAVGRSGDSALAGAFGSLTNWLRGFLP